MADPSPPVRAALDPRFRLRSALSLVLTVALVGATPAAARVVLVGVDGASWNVIDPMLARGELPNLAALMGRGVTARLATVEPVTSPVVWTSIATGRSPEAHGITDFFATRLAVKTPTVFERLAADGARVGLYDYLVTWPPVSLPGGFVIPGWLRRDDRATPPDVWTRAGTTPFVNSYEDAPTNDDYLRRARRDVSLKASRWNALAGAFDVEVGAVSFYAVDMTSHRFWHAAFPEQYEQDFGPTSAEQREAIPAALVGVDRSLGEIAGALAPDDVLLVVSDHGFEARTDGGSPVWVTRFDDALAKADLVPERDGFRVMSTFQTVAVRVHPGDIALRDRTTERLVALLASYRDEKDRPLFARVEALDLAPRPPEHRRSLWERTRQWAVRTAVQWAFGVKIPTGAHAIVFALPDREVLDEAWPDAPVRVGGETMPVSGALSRQFFTGGHHPTAIFVAAGGPIRHEAERKDLSVLDVAPIVFHLAGRGVPDDLEGRVPTEILAPEALAARPPASVPAASLPGLVAADEGEALLDPDLEEKLRRLGYLE